MTEAPPLWFRLPPGYQPFAPGHLSPICEAAGDRFPLAELIFRRGTFYAALGLHEGKSSGAVCTSLLAMSTTRTVARDPRVAAARALVAINRSQNWVPSTQELRAIDGNVPAAFTTGLLHCDGDEPVTVCQAFCCFLLPSTGLLTTVAMSSTDLSNAELYADLLDAVVGSISFEEPSRAPAPRQPVSRLSELMT